MLKHLFMHQHKELRHLLHWISADAASRELEAGFGACAMNPPSCPQRWTPHCTLPVRDQEKAADSVQKPQFNVTNTLLPLNELTLFL